MKCPKCQVENREGAKFCSECGQYLGEKQKPRALSPQSKGGRKFATALRTPEKTQQIFESLKDSEALYRGIVEYTKNGIAVYRPKSKDDFVFIEFNRAAERIEKIPREDVIGKNVCDVFPGVKEFGLLEVMKRVWKTGKPEHHPIAFYKDDRISGWRENFAYRLPSGDVAVVYSDETEHKQAEEALRIANEKLTRFSSRLEKEVQERTTELKKTTEQLVESEKLAALGKMANRIAHELRNPLMVIGGFARRMNAMIADDESLKRMVTIILKEVKTLESKVSEIIRDEGSK